MYGSFCVAQSIANSDVVMYELNNTSLHHHITASLIPETAAGTHFILLTVEASQITNLHFHSGDCSEVFLDLILRHYEKFGGVACFLTVDSVLLEVLVCTLFQLKWLARWNRGN